MDFRKIILFLSLFTYTLSANSLQDAINKASAYSILKLSSGIYLGKLTINKPITIIGTDDNVVIKGDNIGNVITINSSNVTLKNLTISNSGNRLENLDSAVKITKAKNIQIKNCKILDSLYGIYMNIVQDSAISDNYITSKKNDISLKGNALKVWYSHNNIIKNNTIESSKNVTFSYSNNNKIYNNTFLNNMFALHFSKSNNNIIKDNIFKYNSVGIMIMGTKNNKILDNLIQSSNGAAGIGIVIDKVSNLLLQNNTIKYNAKAIYIDTKRVENNYQRFIKNNKILYNKEALHFHSSIKNNVIINNIIKGNLDDVVKDLRGTYTANNLIEYNYWDRYTGFDRNKDNIGDTTHKNFQYADQLWHYNHKIKFFYASPIMTLMNFLANLAPFVEPNLLLEDKKPLINF